MERSYIRIFNGNTLSEIIRIYDIQDAYIFESVNDKYTFDFSILPQPGIEYLTKNNIIVADGDYFRIYKKTIKHTADRGIRVSCEHISYELNTKRDPIKVLYNGTAREILQKMITDNNARYTVDTVDVSGTHSFATETGPLRSRMIEFAKFLNAEIKFLRLGVSILTRRGHDYGLTLELGKNLIDLEETYEVLEDGTTSTSYAVDFIDLNKIVDANGQPLVSVEAHLGDTVYLTGRQLNITQRIMSAGYDPFRKELPTIEIGIPTKNIVKEINNLEAQIKNTPGTTLQEVIYYNFGEEETAITGGWVGYKSTSTDGTIPNNIKELENLKSTLTSRGQGGFRTSNLVDFSRIDTLKFDFDITEVTGTAGVGLQISSTPDGTDIVYLANLFYSENKLRAIESLDVSVFIGRYYVRLIVSAYGGSSVTLKTYRVWGEGYL